MKRMFSVAVVALLLSGSASAQEAPASTAPELKDLKSKVSYLIGTNIGRQMKNHGMDLDLSIFSAGMKDAIAGAKPALSEAEMQAVIAEFGAQQEAKQREMANAAAKQQLEGNADLKKQYEKNTAEATAFLAANGKKEGITTLPSGIQYKVIKSGNGTGVSPKVTDTVHTHKYCHGYTQQHTNQYANPYSHCYQYGYADANQHTHEYRYGYTHQHTNQYADPYSHCYQYTYGDTH